MPPVFVCKNPIKLSEDVLLVDVVEPGHQISQMDPVTEHSEEDVVRKVSHYGHAGYRRYVTAPENFQFLIVHVECLYELKHATTTKSFHALPCLFHSHCRPVVRQGSLLILAEPDVVGHHALPEGKRSPNRKERFPQCVDVGDVVHKV